MMTPTTITCDRCKSTINGFRDESIKSVEFTAGYYVVNEGYWKNYGNIGEINICDACMFIDSRYLKTYGDMRNKKS